MRMTGLRFGAWVVCWLLAGSAYATTPWIAARSPERRAVIEARFPVDADAQWRVSYRNQAMLAAAPLGLKFACAPGADIVIARRRGDGWWLGAITRSSARPVTVSLPAASTKRYRLKTFADDPATLFVPTQAETIVDGGGRITIRMSAAGGFAATPTPIEDKPRPLASARRDAGAQR